MKKKYTFVIEETIHVNDHLRGHAKIVRTPSSKIKRKYGKEIYFGDSYNRLKQAWLSLVRVIDRENDHYCEKLQTEDGELVRDICEPLSEHKDHGAARFSKKYKPSN